MLYWLLDGVMSIFSALYERPLVGGSILIAPVALISVQWCLILLAANAIVVLVDRFGEYLYRGDIPVEVVSVQPQEKEVNYDLDGDVMWDELFADGSNQSVGQS